MMLRRFSIAGLTKPLPMRRGKIANWLFFTDGNQIFRNNQITISLPNTMNIPKFIGDNGQESF